VTVRKMRSVKCMALSRSKPLRRRPVNTQSRRDSAAEGSDFANRQARAVGL
jgi:hypothetical protein